MEPSFNLRWSRLAQSLVFCLAWRPGDCHQELRISGRRLRPASHLPASLEQQQPNDPRQEQHALNQSTSRHLQSRIVNGDDAKGALDFPFFAQWFRGCGGTLIHSDVILTAAHCYSDTLLDHKLRLEGDPKRRMLPIDDYRVHPEFNDATNWVNNNEFDFMLLKLTNPIPQVRPVQLHNREARPLVDQEDLTVVGYGLTTEAGTVAEVLQEATVQYHEDCSFSSYRPEKVGQETMFCAHGRYNDTHSIDSCQGDSGGPIMRQTSRGWIQVGLVSWGEGKTRIVSLA